MAARNAPSRSDPRGRTYVDNNAGTAECDESLSERLRLSRKRIGNPSSLHAEGREARAIVEEARSSIAAVCGVRYPGAVIFTSGATEANRTCILGCLAEREKTGASVGRVITSPVEHASVSHLAERLGATLVPVDSRGFIETKKLASELGDDDVALATFILGHNETGTVQRWKEVARSVRSARRDREAHLLARGKFAGPRLHWDASQFVGKAAFDFSELGADAVTWTAHKFHGPVGIGGMFLSDGGACVCVEDPRLFQAHVGGQEGGIRAGTEDAVGCASAAAALRAVVSRGMAGRWAEIRTAAGTISRRLRDSGANVVVIGCPSMPDSLCNTVNVSIVGAAGADVVAILDERYGVAASTGSACSGSAPSVPLSNMGLPCDVVRGAVRISLSQISNVSEDADVVASALVDIATRR